MKTKIEDWDQKTGVFRIGTQWFKFLDYEKKMKSFSKQIEIVNIRDSKTLKKLELHGWKKIDPSELGEPFSLPPNEKST